MNDIVQKKKTNCKDINLVPHFVSLRNQLWQSLLVRLQNAGIYFVKSQGSTVFHTMNAALHLKIFFRISQ